MRGWVAWLISVLVLFGGVEYVLGLTRIQSDNQLRPLIKSDEQACPAFDAARSPAAPGDYTPAEAHAVFVDAGYDVSSISCVTRSAAAGAAFTVKDAQRARELRVEVYPDVVAAQIAEQRVPSGFTASTWIFNVALFEVEPAEATQTVTAPKGSVDRHYTDLLFSAAHAL